MNLYTSYDLAITVLSPVHIGTGERPDAKTRWETDGRVWVVDEQALLARVAQSPQLLSRFESFCLDPESRLLRFLTQAGVQPDTVALYNIERMGGGASRDFYPHMKLSGKPPLPYIPGSSLKGAFRTCMVRGGLLRSKSARARARTQVEEQFRLRNPKRADDHLEEDFFTAGHPGKNWQNYDWMRLFQFTDSDAISLASLSVTEVHILSVHGTGAAARLEAKTWRPDRPVASHPEVLLPGTQVNASMNILTHLLGSEAYPTLGFEEKHHGFERMILTAKSMAKDLIRQEWMFADAASWREGSMFYGWMVDQLEALGEGECLLRLGWGTGFDSQTVTDLLGEETFREVLDTYGLTVGRPGRDRHRDPLPDPFAPKSRQVALTSRDQWLPLGWVKVAFHPRESSA